MIVSQHFHVVYLRPRKLYSTMVHLLRRPRRKALLIGLDYSKPCRCGMSALPGVHDEVKMFHDHLVDFQHYREEDIRVMLDGGGIHSMLMPTRTNIVRHKDILSLFIL